MPSWVYILRCSDGSYYTGVTSNLEQRLDQHHHGEVGYTAKRKPLEYSWSDEFANIDDAIAFEKRVKGWSRAKKEALMRGDWAEIQRLAGAKRRPSTSSGLVSAAPVTAALQRQPEPVEGEREEALTFLVTICARRSSHRC